MSPAHTSLNALATLSETSESLPYESYCVPTKKGRPFSRAPFWVIRPCGLVTESEGPAAVSHGYSTVADLESDRRSLVNSAVSAVTVSESAVSESAVSKSDYTVSAVRGLIK